MKQLLLFHLVIHHSQRENDQITFEVIMEVICIILLFTVYRPDKQYKKIKETLDYNLAIRRIFINIYIWIGAVFGTYATIKEIINY